MQAFRDAPIGMAVVGTDERILEANDALCRMLGYSQEELLARTVIDITHPDDLQVETEHKAAAYHDRVGSFQVQKRYVRADGSVLMGRLSVSTTYGPDGSPSYFVGQLEDVTEQQRLHTQLSQLQRLESLGQLAGGVAHDFNNMLAVILGFGEILGETLQADAQRRDLDEIMRAAERARDLTRQLLAVGRRGQLGPDVIDINQSVRDTARMLDRVLGSDVQVALDLEASVGAARIDEVHLEQILLNLAVNARDAMPTGGTFRISTTIEHVATQRPGLSPGAYVRLEIRDDGVGMSDDTTAHLFEPFFTTKAAGHGTGLGLATVYGIVRQTQGHITVASAPGRGTTFTLWIPASKAATRPDEPGHPVEATRPGRILFAEDEPALRSLCQRVLAGAGYEVLVASDGGEALHHAAAAEPLDLLITDVTMPDMHGPRLADILHQSRPDLSVLFISGHARGAVPSGGDGAHVDFLAKPFRPDDLLQRVQGLLERRHLTKR